MEWFKHFVKAHDSDSMVALMNAQGIEAYARYFILIELCAKKLEKEKHESITEVHCRFSLHETTVRQRLRIGRAKLAPFLDHCQTLGLLQWELIGQEFSFYIPKLLEFMDREFKRSRRKRGVIAETPHAELEVELEVEEEKNIYPKGLGSGASVSEKITVDACKLAELISEWGVTLQHFKISKDPRLDDANIAKLVMRHGGNFEKVRLALIGQRYEAKTEKFDPAKHVSIIRISNSAALFEKFVNLGSQDQSGQTQAGSDYSFLKEAK